MNPERPQEAALTDDFPMVDFDPLDDREAQDRLEQAGWKGKSLGPVGMFEKQALVLVNHGGATGADVLRTMAAVRAAVHKKFGVALTPEPIFL
jgi:UDP-N-acetylmuramate dehydrogenase